MGFTLRRGQQVKVLLMTLVGISAAYGAITIQGSTLRRSDGSTKDFTPADAKMVEKGHPVSPAVTGVVATGGVGTFSVGGGPAGEDIYDITLGTGEGAGFAVGDLVRSQAAGKQAIYKVLAVTGDVLTLHAGTGEMLIEVAATVEKVTGEGNYLTYITVTYDDLNSMPSSLETEIDVRGPASRGNAPASDADFEVEDKQDFSVGASSPRPVTL